MLVDECFVTTKNAEPITSKIPEVESGVHNHNRDHNHNHNRDRDRDRNLDLDRVPNRSGPDMKSSAAARVDLRARQDRWPENVCDTGL